MFKFISFLFKCALTCVIGFVIFIALAIIPCPGSSSSDNSCASTENYMDGSDFHAIYAKNLFSDNLKQNMKDPSSYEVVDYKTNYNAARQCYVVDITCRARNSFNGYVVERYMADVTFNGENVSFNNVIRLS